MLNDGALSGLKVVEFADFVSGPYCGKLLADLGAEVIKVETPGMGDPARRTEPFQNDLPHPERSGLFLYLNTSKLGVTLSVAEPRGLEMLKELLCQADVLIENHRPVEARRLGIDYTSLAAVNPRLIVTSVTSFGQSGPYADYHATDLISANMGGLAFLTPFWVNDPEKEPPLRPGGRQTDFVAGSTAALATMFAVFERMNSGKGRHVDVSEQESIASFVRMEAAFYTHDPKGMFQAMFAKRNALAMPVGYIPCKDGYVIFGLREEYQWTPFLEEMLGPRWREDERMKGVFPDPENWDFYALIAAWGNVVRPIVLEWAETRTKEEIFRMAVKKNLPIAACNNMEELLASEQLAARQFFVEVDHPETGKVIYPGAPFKLDRTPSRIRRPAPCLGEHNEEIWCRRMGHSKGELVKLRESGIV